MSKVFVVDAKKQPLNPVHPGRARILLRTGKAAVLKHYPFTLVLKAAVEHPVLEPLRLKIDPGSRVSGLALVNDASGEVVWASELTHRGQAIKKRLDERRAVRRSRRRRQSRYRKARWENRRNKKKGWLPPSLESRISNVETWIKRLMRLCPIMALSQELVRFDLQQVENPDISGIEYQQGTLAGYEIKEYLLEKWGRQCVYCGKTDMPLHVEHIAPRSKSHDDRISNLTLACKPCNEKKGTQDIGVFLKDQPALREKLLKQAKTPLRDAAAVNATRWALYHRLQALGVPVECGSGGVTKYNRTTRALPKTHWLDACCVGKSTPQTLQVKGIIPLLIKANGHGSRQMCLMDAFGFPRTKPKQARVVKGFATGDLVKAVVPTSKKAGTYVGRVAVRATGSFNISTKEGTVQGISYRHCTLLHRCDGYSYSRPAGRFLFSFLPGLKNRGLQKGTL